jgi:hypothetical protein
MRTNSYQFPNLSLKRLPGGIGLVNDSRWFRSMSFRAADNQTRLHRVSRIAGSYGKNLRGVEDEPRMPWLAPARRVVTGEMSIFKKDFSSDTWLIEETETSADVVPAKPDLPQPHHLLGAILVKKAGAP